MDTEKIALFGCGMTSVTYLDQLARMGKASRSSGYNLTLRPIEDSFGYLAVRVWRMRKAIKINLAEADRQALTAIVTDRNSPQKHVWRAQIVLLTADGCGTTELTRRSGTSKTSVWRWQDRFQAEGVPGLLRDKTRRSRIPPLTADVQARVVAATQARACG